MGQVFRGIWASNCLKRVQGPSTDEAEVHSEDIELSD